MPKRYGVIDLGTNTFHLLVKEVQADGSLKQIHKQRIYVKLAEEGIGKIGEQSFRRAVETMQTYRIILDELEVEKVLAFGTAALRTASNGADLAKVILEKANIEVQIIPGLQEAKLIHKGVLQAIPPQEGRMVIMDIGGGSVEFIIADESGVIWAESFPIGAAVLYNNFHKENPISSKELEALNAFLSEKLKPFDTALEKYPVDVLIGASGTFDVVAYCLKGFQDWGISAEVEVKEFYPLYEKIVGMTIEERLNSPLVPANRADMIVVAMELIFHVLDKIKISKIVVSDYAMKEGILQEMIEG